MVKTNMTNIKGHLAHNGYTIGCFNDATDIITNLTTNQMRRLRCALLEETTDLVLVSRGMKYVVEVKTVDDEKDINVMTKCDYDMLYGFN